MYTTYQPRVTSRYFLPRLLPSTDMEPCSRKWQARRDIIVNGAIFGLQVITLQIVKASKHVSKNHVEFAICKTCSHQLIKSRGLFWGALLDPNAHSAAFSKGNVSFLKSSHFLWVRPSVGIEFERIRPVLFVMMELPCSH